MILCPRLHICMLRAHRKRYLCFSASAAQFKVTERCPGTFPCPVRDETIYDGISLYHMAPDKRDIKSLTEIIGLISARAYDKAAECLQLFFSIDEYIALLPLIDDLQGWIIAHKDRIDAGALYEFSRTLLKESQHIESVKFALCCLELLNI